ncbi:MAG TPA: DUF1385 domain-containing protein [bacterium]|nr:DUF1385 domain-containing protein [bacterium]HPM58036.1 DUF1385 domain-containing protein [bacterium]
MKEQESLAVGGQAIIEGVMMRGKDVVAMAVRKPDGGIVLKCTPFKSIVKRFKVLNLPVFRGAVLLIESLFLGVKALNFSGDIAMMEENGGTGKAGRSENRWNDVWMGVTILFSLALGIAFFFYLPLILTDLLGFESGWAFNLVDGVIRLVLFLAYIYLISLWKEIKRVFEYHGAEHKSIFAHENNQPLTPAGAMPFTTFHPRCGTSFLLIVMVVSVLVFMLLGKPETVADRLIRIAFVPVIGGLSYELIKFSARAQRFALVRAFILPGLWLQRITTNEPDEQQIEVAMVALRCALGQEVQAGPSPVEMVA